MIVGPDGAPSPLSGDQLEATLTEMFEEDIVVGTLEVHHTSIIDGAMVVVAEAGTSAERREQLEELGLEGTALERVGLLVEWVEDPYGAWRWPRTAFESAITDDGWASVGQLPSGQHILAWGSAHPGGTIELRSGSNITATYQLEDQPSGLATIDQAGDPTVTAP